MTYLEEYNYLIQGRHVIAGYWIKKEVENLIQDLKVFACLQPPLWKPFIFVPYILYFSHVN